MTHTIAEMEKMETGEVYTVPFKDYVLQKIEERLLTK